MTNFHVEGNGGGLKHRSWIPHGSMGNSLPFSKRWSFLRDPFPGLLEMDVRLSLFVDLSRDSVHSGYSSSGARRDSQGL